MTFHVPIIMEQYFTINLLNKVIMKTKKIYFVLLAILGVSIYNMAQVVNADLKAKNALKLNDIEAIAQSENGPGNYKGARNQYCIKPSGQIGCVNDSDPTRTCSYSIFCQK